MRLTIKATLLAILLVLGGVLVLTAWTGRSALSTANGDLRTVYEARVVPLRDLKTISDDYAVFVVDATHKVRNGNWGWEEAAASVDEAADRIARLWSGYRARGGFDAEEQRIVADTARQIGRAHV